MKSTVRSLVGWLAPVIGILPIVLTAENAPQDNWAYYGTRIEAAPGESFQGLATGADGRVYAGINTGSGYVVGVFDPNGTEQYRFGSFSSIYGIALDSAENIYVLDLGATNKVRVFENDGTPLREWGPEGTAPGEISQHYGDYAQYAFSRITISESGTVFIADSANYRVQSFSDTGTFIKAYGEYGNVLGQFNDNPVAILIRDAASLYVICSSQSSTTEFLLDGTPVRKDISYTYGNNACRLTDGTFAIGWGSFLILPADLNQYVGIANLSGTGYGYSPEPNGGVWAALQTEIRLYERHYRTTDNPPSGNKLPLPEVLSVSQQPGTTHVEIEYIVHDADDATVETRAVAFVDGIADLDHLIPVQTWVGDTTGLIGNGVATNTPHTVTWNPAADWDADFGDVKIAVLAKDNRDLIGFHWVTIPADGSNPELVVSKRPLTHEDLHYTWFWLLAGNDPDIELVDGTVRGVTQYAGLKLGSNDLGRTFLFQRLGIRPIQPDEETRLNAGRYGLDYVDPHSVVQESLLLQSYVTGWGGKGSELDLPFGTLNVQYIDAGYNHSLAIKNNGSVVAWGDSNQVSPPEGLNDVTAVSSGNDFSLALKSDGTVVGWGYGQYGQATPPSGLTDVIAIEASYTFSLALESDGTVIGWGYDHTGSAITIPSGITDVIAIAAGGSHSLALKSDGTVVGWGSDSEGQAAPPEGLTDVVAIAAGGSHSLALKGDGTVVGWGRDSEGQAAPPEGLTDVVAIAAGGSHSLALKGDGTVVGWGSNEFSQATPPEGLTNVSAISAGANHSLVIVNVAP